MKTERLDQLLVQRGLVESREKAQRLIRAGAVRVRDQVATKPGVRFPEESELTVDQGPRFVSRGGDKLAGALEGFEIGVAGRICIDVGASTGGFTDCLLQNGAERVYAVDVGKGQLHWNLRNDPRVVVFEGLNARELNPANYQPPPSMAVVDVSFISLTKVLPALKNVLTPDAIAVTLIKPQFEAGRAQVAKGGVVRDPAVHQAVVENVQRFGVDVLGWHWEGVMTSPLTGPAGNIEFLAYWRIK